MTAVEISIADANHHLCEAMSAIAQIINEVDRTGATDLFEAVRHLTRSAEHLGAFSRVARGRPGLAPLRPNP